MFLMVILTNLGMYLRRIGSSIRRTFWTVWRQVRRAKRSILSKGGKKNGNGTAELLRNDGAIDDDDIGNADDICSLNQIPVPETCKFELEEYTKMQISPFTVSCCSFFVRITQKPRKVAGS